MADPVRQLKIYGRDVLGIQLSRLPTSLRKAAFLCINTYTSYRLALGTGPIFDAVNLAKVLKNFGFEVFFLHNPHVRNFLIYLDRFFQNTTEQLVLYYVGRGMSLKAPGTETDEPKDKALVFDDGIISDDTFADHLIENKHPACQIVLITDACFTGSVWDIQTDGTVKGRPFPPNIVALTGRVDFLHPKSQTISRTDQGVVTYQLAKTLKADEELTPNQIAEKLAEVLVQHAQTFTVAATTPELLDQPLFRA